MTTHEAINILRNTAWLGTNEDREKTEQAVEIVAEALEREPTCRNFRQIDFKRGMWVDWASELDAGFGRHEFVCSECSVKANYYVGGSEDWWDAGKPNYCPHCGARMESDEE